MPSEMDTTILQQSLSHGKLELKGQFMLGSNYTFLVNVHYNGQELQAVYKPSKGEQPLWDFPDHTLAHREVAAYLVSEALGWNFVPFTALREDGPSSNTTPIITISTSAKRTKPAWSPSCFSTCCATTPTARAAMSS